MRRNETRVSKKLTLSTAKTAGCRRFPWLDTHEIYPRRVLTRKYFVQNGVSDARAARKFLIQAARKPLNPYFCTVMARKKRLLAMTRTDFCRIHYQRAKKIGVSRHHHAQSGIFVPWKMSRKINRHHEKAEARTRHDPDNEPNMKKFFIF